MQQLHTVCGADEEEEEQEEDKEDEEEEEEVGRPQAGLLSGAKYP